MRDQDKINQIKQMIETAYDALAHAKKLFDELAIEGNDEVNNNPQEEDLNNHQAIPEAGEANGDDRVVEGIFDGLNMIGPSGKQYSIPQNYASKSKLVEGDRLKLTINDDGSFLYKQIGPMERRRIVGVLTRNGEGEEYRVLAQGKSYKVILASVTYYKGEEGDEAVILVPKDREANWAAVENIIKQGEERPVLESELGSPVSQPQVSETDIEKEKELASTPANDNILNSSSEEIDQIEEI